MPKDYTQYSDPALNSFKKTNVFYTENDLLKYQDPTYLGFKLFFLFDQPSSGLLSREDHPNTAYGYLKRIGDERRLSYLVQFVTLLQRINTECPWFWQSIDGLAEAWKHGYETEGFKPLLPKEAKITINTLDESVDLRMTALMDLYRKACFDWPNRREIVPKNLRYFNVSVYCYEARTINRAGDPFGNYKKDGGSILSIAPTLPPRYKETVSVNKSNSDKLFGKDPLLMENGVKNPNENQDYINSNISRVMFDFSYCQWLPDESGVMFEGLSHKEMSNKAQKLVFSYRQVNEVNLYRMFGDKLVTDMIIPGLDQMALDDPKPYSVTNPPGFTINGPENPLLGVMNPLWQKVLATQLQAERFLDQFRVPTEDDLGNIYFEQDDPLDSLPKAQRDAAKRAIAEALRASAKLRQLFLGNIYGFSLTGTATALATGLASTAQSIAREVGKNASRKNDTDDLVRIDSVSYGSSLSNDGGSNPATSQITGNPQSSLTNINGSNPATNQGALTENVSLSNDDGPDSSNQGSPIGNASLNNQ